MAQLLRADLKFRKKGIFDISYRDFDNENIIAVDTNDQKMKCSCFYNNQWGIPCKHMICVKLFLKNDSLYDSQISNRWKADININN